LEGGVGGEQPPQGFLSGAGGKSGAFEIADGGPLSVKVARGKMTLGGYALGSDLKSKEMGMCCRVEGGTEVGKPPLKVRRIKSRATQKAKMNAGTEPSGGTSRNHHEPLEEASS